MHVSSFDFNVSPTNGCSSSTGADEERAVEAAIKGLSEFSHYINIDINYQGENIHGMINDEETHISPLGKILINYHPSVIEKGKYFTCLTCILIAAVALMFLLLLPGRLT